MAEQTRSCRPSIEEIAKGRSLGATHLLREQPYLPGNGYEFYYPRLQIIANLGRRLLGKQASEPSIRQKKTGGWYPWLANWHRETPQPDLIGAIPYSLVRHRRGVDCQGRIGLYQYQPALLEGKNLIPAPSIDQTFFEICEELPLKSPVGAWVLRQQIFFDTSGVLGSNFPPPADVDLLTTPAYAIENRSPDEYDTLEAAEVLMRRLDKTG
ncbi:MAG TPA: hypothetical protein VF733_02690 [Candidatus Saccharimonadales bacterium]